MHQHCWDVVALSVFRILPGNLLEKKATLQHQEKPLPTALLQYIYQCFVLLCLLLRVFSHLGCLADHVGMQTTSEEVSQRGCHTRNNNSFLLSICSFRSWRCSSPMSLRSLQPDSTGSGGLHVASGYFSIYLNCWVCRSKIQDPGSTPHVPRCPQFSLPWTISASVCNVLLWRERNSHLISVQIVFYYRQEEDRIEKLQTTSSEVLHGLLEIMCSWWKSQSTCKSAHPGPTIRHNGPSADPHLSTAWAWHSSPPWLWRGTCVLGCCCCSGSWKDASGNLPPWLLYPTQGFYLSLQRLPWSSLLQVTGQMETHGFNMLAWWQYYNLIRTLRNTRLPPFTVIAEKWHQNIKNSGMSCCLTR